MFVDVCLLPDLREFGGINGVDDGGNASTLGVGWIFDEH